MTDNFQGRATLHPPNALIPMLGHGVMFGYSDTAPITVSNEHIFNIVDLSPTLFNDLEQSRVVKDGNQPHFEPGDTVRVQVSKASAATKIWGLATVLKRDDEDLTSHNSSHIKVQLQQGTQKIWHVSPRKARRVPPQ